jgi:hypothetical protein
MKPDERDARVGLRLVADVEPRRAPKPLAAVRKLLHGDVYSFDPHTLRTELFYDFRDAAQAQDWTRTLKDVRDTRKGEKVQVRDGRLYFANTKLKAITHVQFTQVDVALDFRIAGGTNAATVVVCADGKGTHYELCGNWYDDFRKKWICQLFTYRKGKCPLNELGKKWPVRPSPFGPNPRGTMAIGFEAGRLYGSVARGDREVRLTAEDNGLRSGSVGVWAYEAHEGWFDNIHIDGRLDRGWLARALKDAHLGELAELEKLEAKPASNEGLRGRELDRKARGHHKERNKKRNRKRERDRN